MREIQLTAQDRYSSGEGDAAQVREIQLICERYSSRVRDTAQVREIQLTAQVREIQLK